MQPYLRYCWNCFAPLVEPTVVVDESRTPLSAHSAELQDRATRLFQTLEIPLYSDRNRIVMSQENNVSFCSQSCRDSAEFDFASLLRAMRSNDPVVEASRTLATGGLVSFNLFSRLLALAANHPKRITGFMNR